MLLFCLSVCISNLHVWKLVEERYKQKFEIILQYCRNLYLTLTFPFDLPVGELTTGVLSDEEITDLINYINQRLPPESQNDWSTELQDKSNKEDDWTDSRPIENGFGGTEDMMGNGEGLYFLQI